MLKFMFLLLPVVFVAACSLFLGTVEIPIAHIASILAETFGLDTGIAHAPWENTVVLEVRLPRIVLAVFVGGSLALAGSVMQGMFRNPLACPSITGVSSGAALGAVGAIFFGLASRSAWAIPVLAFLGGLASAWCVYSLSVQRGQVSVAMLLLAGVALNSINTALIAFLLSLSFANFETGKQIVFWTLGGLDQQTWARILPVLPVIALGSCFMLFYSRDLDALTLGELHAASVGVEPGRVRRRLIAASALVTAAGVSLCGTIGFVGLIVPHIMRVFTGPHHRALFPAALAGGALFLLLADIAARTLIAPEEIRLGVITAACGGPFFLYLLLTREREHFHG